MPRKKSAFLSDLVRDSRIETEFLGSCTQHVFHETGRLVGERRLRREERWVRECFLGQGSYGMVYLEKLETEPSIVRAVKEIKKFIIPGQELDYTRELEAIMKFSHPKYQHCFVTSRGWFDLQDSVYITMDFHELGDLQRHLENPLPEPDAKQIAEQVLEGLGFMHENGFIHRDLKPANIMVVTKRPKWWVKIADFGISKRRQHGVTTMFTLQRGTFGFAAPEAIIADDPNETYTFSVDMWSLGAVVYKMLTNLTAFPSIASLLDFSRGALPFPTLKLTEHQVSDDGQDFVVKLMEARPDARLTAVSAEQHPWIINVLSSTTASETMSSCTVNEGDMTQQETNISTASRAWSTDDLTVIPATVIKQSNYQPPSVTDHLDETDGLKRLTYPADQNYPILDVVSDVQDISAPGHITTFPKPPVIPETATCIQESFQNSLTDESVAVENSSNSALGLNSDDDAVLAAEDGAPELNSAVAQVLDIEQTSQLQKYEDEAYTSSSEDDYSEFYAKSDVDPSQACEAETVFLEPNSNLETPSGDRTEETSNNTQSFTGEEGLEQDNEPQGKVVYCSHCEEAFSYSTYPIEALACGHLMCHSCLIRVICLSLVSPKHMPPRCCESDAGKIGLEQFSRLILHPDVDKMISRISILKFGWICPRGHSPKDGSLLTTTGQTPIWKETVNCSGCLTQTWDSARTKSSANTVSSEFCLLCSREMGSGESCDCWTIWSVIEKILAVDDSKLSCTDVALQRAFNTRFKMKGGAVIDYQTLEKTMGEEDEQEDGSDFTEDTEDPEGDYTSDDLEDDSDDDYHLYPNNYTNSKSVLESGHRLNARPNPDHYQEYLSRSPGPPPESRIAYVEDTNPEYPWRVYPYTNQPQNSHGPTFSAYSPYHTNSNNQGPPLLKPCRCGWTRLPNNPNDLTCEMCGESFISASRTRADDFRRISVRGGISGLRPMPLDEPIGLTPSFASRDSPRPLTSENLRYIPANRTIRNFGSDRLAHLNGATNPEAILEGAGIEDVKTWQLESAYPHPETRNTGKSPYSRR